MTPFEWPQYVMAGLMLLVTTYCVVYWIRDTTLTPYRVSVQVLVLAVEVVLFSWLLRAGGFW